MPDPRRTDPPARPGGIPDGVLVGLLAFLLGLAVLIWSATGLAALLSKGAWPDTVTFTHTPGAIRALITEPHDLAGAWPDTNPTALSGWGLFWGLFIGQLLILLVLTIFTLGVITRAKSRAQKPTDPPPTSEAAPSNPAPPAFEARGSGGSAPGNAAAPTTLPAPPTHEAAPPPPAPPAFEAQSPGGSAPSNAAAPTTLPAPPTHEAAPPPPAPPAFEAQSPGGSAPGNTTAPATLPAPRLAYAPPPTRHTTAKAALAAITGPALVITSAPTLWATTKDARAKIGPVLLYDPSHLCDTPSRMHWNPTTGCADRDTAAARATALLAPVRPTARMDAAIAETAETLLRSWLHAAALDDRPFKQLHRWAQGTNAQDPVRILRTHPRATPGAAGELESALTAHPERREQAQHLTARALSCLSSVHIRDACNPNRTDSLTLASFVTEGGTLYVVGEPLEDPRTHPGAMPLLTALAASVVEHGRRMAARSSHGRLDPPLALILDDVAAVAPIPQLPELLQDDTLPLLALCRSREQARARWPEAAEFTPAGPHHR
ncbi:hypothetical protein GCM10010347_58840 [Streptomyces cirratus]|uniref:Type VI secretion protein n=1 Tax=Streptomyces cirratus TaxID=68187 RepID=A0ABQ3F521_9ACTN|nr:type VI secretion protein [Streptomyces cirratus]GHB80392.1 hypothetical protein GCM10010347_58840 [Streptomyces cirratus]